MGIPEIYLYNSLRKKMGEEETTGLMEYVKSEVKSEFDARACVFMTKDDKIELMGRASNDKAELIDRINETKVELIGRINETKVELIDRINKVKTETITWIVGVGVLQFVLSILSKKFL